MLTPPAAGLHIGGLNPHTGHGVVRVDGPGSRIDATASGQFLNVGRFGDGSVGDLSITNGGVLDTVFLNIGREGATGNVVIDGPGSAARLRGRDAAGNPAGGSVGRDGGTGHLTIRNEGSLSIESPDGTAGSPGLSLGRVFVPGSGGDGSITVESGGTLTITGNALGGGLNIGRDEGATGTMAVRSGGAVRINSLLAGGGFTLGDAGHGTLTIDGGTVLLDGQMPSATPGGTLGNVEGGRGSLALQNGASLTFNRPSSGCCLTVGRLGEGSLSITGGSKLVLNDTSSQQGGGIAFGGNNGTTAGGPFSALVSGAGSEITIKSRNGGMSVGYHPGSAGTFTLSEGAAFNGEIIRLGRNAGSAATFNVDGAGTKANLLGDASSTSARGITVGESGQAQLNVGGGAVIHIHAPVASNFSGVQVGGALAGSGGKGSLSVAGQGTKVETTGAAGTLAVGVDVTRSKPSAGAVTVTGGGVIQLDPAAHGSIGRSHGSTGSLDVSGPGSLVDTGSFLGIGLGPNDTEGGTGSVVVSNGAVVKAVAIRIGPGGTLAGNGGTVIGNVSNLGGLLSPGQSPGPLAIDGAYESLGGKLRIEVAADGSHDVLAVSGPASFDPSSQVEVRLDPEFRPANGASLDVVRGKAAPDASVTTLLRVKVAPGGGVASVEGPLGTLPTSIAVEPVASPATLVAAVLPSSRSVMVGAEATAYLTIINMGKVAAENVVIAPTTSLPARFAFQWMESSGAPKAAIDAPARIEAGKAESFIISFTPTAPIAPTEVSFAFAGVNTASLTPQVGVNTLLLSASATPVPDIVAVAVTESADGIVQVPGEDGTGAFAVATVNVGASGVITVAPRLADASIPATVAICETEPSTGLCKAAPAPSVTTQIDPGQTPAYAVIVQGEGVILFDPAVGRVFVEFRDADGVVRGKTSVAVRTQ